MPVPFWATFDQKLQEKFDSQMYMLSLEVTNAIKSSVFIWGNRFLTSASWFNNSTEARTCSCKELEIYQESFDIYVNFKIEWRFLLISVVAFLQKIGAYKKYLSFQNPV